MYIHLVSLSSDSKTPNSPQLCTIWRISLSPSVMFFICLDFVDNRTDKIHIHWSSLAGIRAGKRLITLSD